MNTNIKRTCPQCGWSVTTLITDLATGTRFCWHCTDDKEMPAAVVSRKMDELGLENYPLEERMRDLRGEKPEKKLIKPEEVAKIVAKEFPGVRVTSVSYADFLFLYQIGAMDWDFAATMSFQHVIHDHGTQEEKQRLREMKVGYWA